MASEPHKFLMPEASDMRYQWVCVRLDALDVDELREIIIDAWRMCVPKSVAQATKVDCRCRRWLCRGATGRRADAGHVRCCLDRFRGLGDG